MAQTNKERMERRYKTEPWLYWRKTARWHEARDRIFERDGFTCQCGCGVVERDTKQLVCAHRRAHEGNEALFWDDGNMHTLLKACAVKRPQSSERYTRGVWD